MSSRTGRAKRLLAGSAGRITVVSEVNVVGHGLRGGRRRCLGGPQPHPEQLGRQQRSVPAQARRRMAAGRPRPRHTPTPSTATHGAAAGHRRPRNPRAPLDVTDGPARRASARRVPSRRAPAPERLDAPPGPPRPRGPPRRRLSGSSAPRHSIPMTTDRDDLNVTPTITDHHRPLRHRQPRHRHRRRQQRRHRDRPRPRPTTTQPRTSTPRSSTRRR